jgi:hypothetical protein
VRYDTDKARPKSFAYSPPANGPIYSTDTANTNETPKRNRHVERSKAMKDMVSQVKSEYHTDEIRWLVMKDRTAKGEGVFVFI